MIKASYKTIAKAAQAELTERKSRFIACVQPVSKEDEALALISRVRSKYYDARHHVYAYILDENNISRYSDDGEPSGTAGLPVLDVLKKEALTNVAVVVARYFGGTLLGTGGLVRAYSTAAKLGIEAGGITLRTLCDMVSVRADYTLLGKIKHETAAAGFVVGDIAYADDVTLSVYCQAGSSDAYISLIRDVTGARAVCRTEGQCYIDK